MQVMTCDEWVISKHLLQLKKNCVSVPLTGDQNILPAIHRHLLVQDPFSTHCSSLTMLNT